MSFWLSKKTPLYAPMLSTLGGGSARGFNPGGGGGPITIDDITVTFDTAASFPSNITTGNNYPSISYSKDPSNNRGIIRQTQQTGQIVDSGLTTNAYWGYMSGGSANQFTNTNTFNAYGEKYDVSASGEVWIALQGGGGSGGIGGFGGSGGGSGGFVLVKVDLSQGSGYYVRAAQGYFGVPSAFGTVSNNFRYTPGVSSDLYRGNTLLARALGGQGGISLNQGDSVQPGGSGGNTYVLTSDSAIVASYANNGSTGGSTTDVNSANLGGGASPPVFTYTSPSTSLSSGDNGLPLNSTYHGGGAHDATAGDGVVGSIGPNTWAAGYSNNITNGDLVNNNSNGGGNTAGVDFQGNGYMGGGGGGQDRANSNYYGTFNSPGFVAFYGTEAIS